MVELNLTIIAAAIAIVTAIWKFANSISEFGHSVDSLKEAMEDSRKDRQDLRRVVNGHSEAIVKINTQYVDIKEDLDEIKRKVS